MRILLVSVPHPSIGSRIPDDHLPPLGLRPDEILRFLPGRRTGTGPTVSEFRGDPQDAEGLPDGVEDAGGAHEGGRLSGTPFTGRLARVPPRPGRRTLPRRRRAGRC